MPVNSVHPDYARHADEFIDCRNATNSKAVKAAGERYLPRLRNQAPEDYEAYKKRAVFFGITSKTVSALVGMAMMRDPRVTNSPRMDSYFKDLQGHQFLELCSSTISEVLLMGGHGILIDAPLQGALNPSIVRYNREDVINWRIDPRNGQLTMVMLREVVERQKSATDEYEYVQELQYRKLWLDSDGAYTVTIFDDTLEQRDSFQPRVKGVPVKFIPFYMITPFGVSMTVERSPVIDIVELNYSHYRTSADLEHGRHFTGLPTPVIIGVEATTEIYIGSEKALILPDPSSDAKFLEYNGQGLTSLEKGLAEKQGQMASMSARLIDNSKRGSEAAETVKLRYVSESASLITVVRAVEGAFNMIYGQIAQFMDEEAPLILLNKEFLETKMTPAELTAMVSAYIEGTISEETFLNNLRRGDVISPHQSDEEEKARMIELRKQREELEKKQSQRSRAGQGATAQ